MARRALAVRERGLEEAGGKEAKRQRCPLWVAGGWVFLFLVPCAFVPSAFVYNEHTLIL